MSYSFSDTKLKLFNEYGVDYIPCPVGAHYVHGKVERKIRADQRGEKICSHSCPERAAISGAVGDSNGADRQQH